MGNIIILSGTPGVGTRHLYNALTQLHPDVARNLERVVLYTSRIPRPSEKDGIDYHFRSKEAILARAAAEKSYTCFSAHEQLQALDLDEVKRIVSLEGKTGFLEIHPTVVPWLMGRAELSGANLTTVFLSPVSQAEIRSMLAGGGIGKVSEYIKNLTVRKLMMRTSWESMPHSEITEADRRDIAAQAQGAFDELMSAVNYRWVIPNHHGEGDPNWGWGSKDPVFGDAARTLAGFVAIIRGEEPPHAENWRGLFPAKGTLAMGVPISGPLSPK